jgi:hypothetical protein
VVGGTRRIFKRLINGGLISRINLTELAHRPRERFRLRANAPLEDQVAAFGEADDLLTYLIQNRESAVSKAGHTRHLRRLYGLATTQREIVGKDARMRWEKSSAPSAACAASLISDRR